MKKIILLSLLFLTGYPATLLKAQTDKKLKEDIRKTGFVHSPLSLDYSKSFESFGLTKKVLLSDLLCDMENLDGWSHKGIGSLSLTTEISRTAKTRSTFSLSITDILQSPYKSIALMIILGTG